MRIARDAALLVLAGALLGLVGNGFTPRPAPFGARVVAAAELPGATCSAEPHGSSIPRVSVEEAMPLCVACTAAFVDARSAREYESGHINGALHLAPGEDPAPLLPKLTGTVIVYDRDASCAIAESVAAELVKRGVKDVRVLTGAWPAWVAGGGPGESGECAVCAGASK